MSFGADRICERQHCLLWWIMYATLETEKCTYYAKKGQDTRSCVPMKVQYDAGLFGSTIACVCRNYVMRGR